MIGRPRLTPARLAASLVFALTVLVVAAVRVLGPDAFLASHAGDIHHIVVYYSWLPRLTVALLGGGGLGLAGVLLQQTLRNPLASPTTLGVANGAQLALLLATLFGPAWLIQERGAVAFAGGALAMGLVFALAWRRALAPAVTVLAGLVVNLYLGAFAIVLVLFNQEQLKGLMIWGAGSLAQNNWHSVFYLLPRLALGGVVAALLARALAVLDLDDINARNLGVSLKYLRAASLGVAVFVTACVVARLGVIGFVGLAAPAIAGLAGARTLGARLCWSPVFGALLLAITDQALQRIAGLSSTLIPTGATTAALGAPVLLWLIRGLRTTRGSPPGDVTRLAVRRASGRRVMMLGVAAIAVSLVALAIGQGIDGWRWPLAGVGSPILTWRLPRVLSAGAAGAMLALAGTVIQRISDNPMASPEVLGVTAGTGLGLLALMWFVPAAGTPAMLAAGTLGALATLALLLTLNARSGFDPERLLLTGISVMFLFDAVQRIVLAGGDPRTQALLAWMSGSTYHVDLATSLTVSVLALALFALTRPLAAWLDLLPLGVPTARSLGLDVSRSRLILLLLVAVLTAGATLIVGPLSFVGLIAPHMARLFGLSRAREHMTGSIALGASLMIAADWVGRQIMFPMEIPAGLVASLLGGAYFMWQLRRL